MTEAINQQYMCAGWVLLSSSFGDDDSDAAREFLELARPKQLAYQHVMATCQGNPVGVECRAASRPAWAFVLPEVRKSGQFRVQYFDENGFSGDSAFNTLEDAVEEMVGNGFRIIDAGALDRTAATVRWERGVKVAALHQRCEEGLITYADYVAGVKALGTMS